ncbi:ATP-binding protein [Adlercreutzia sp. ZJ154]|uniref:ATP-binding protein n=1 Tax=Adlercreutzia sp. ZJ154 TaxID=2709790 RepID=UPI0013ECED20|nr:ATP-binding protein [Adlercreutzia sp. ZJ154]
MTDLSSIVREYREAPLPALVARDEVIRSLPSPQRFNLVEIVTGMRRSGKTFYLFQKMKQLLEAGVPRERMLHFNFADDRLSPMDPHIMDNVLNEYWRQAPKARERGAYLFLDEVQEADQWQGFCQRVAEMEQVTLVVTGSSSKLSSDEIATQFRGRSHSHEMLPLSFREYCRFAGVERIDIDRGATPQMQTQLEGMFDRYLTEGGFPGVQNKRAEDRIELLQGYVRDVVARDVADRFGREDIRLANQFALYGLRNTACEFSINGLVEAMKELGYKMYWEKASRLVTLLEQAFLFFEVPEYAVSLKPQSTALPKVYAIDPGITYAVSRANQQDIGKRFETAVFLELRRRLAGRRIDTLTSYTVPDASRHKVDFLLGDALASEPYALMQVSLTLENERTRAREVGSLAAAMSATRLARGTIITLREEDRFEIDEGTIEVVPAWKWFLTSELP